MCLELLITARNQPNSAAILNENWLRLSGPGCHYIGVPSVGRMSLPPRFFRRHAVLTSAFLPSSGWSQGVRPKSKHYSLEDAARSQIRKVIYHFASWVLPHRVNFWNCFSFTIHSVRIIPPSFPAPTCIMEAFLISHGANLSHVPCWRLSLPRHNNGAISFSLSRITRVSNARKIWKQKERSTVR